MRAGLMKSFITVQAQSESEGRLGSKGVEWVNLYKQIRARKKRKTGGERDLPSGTVTAVTWEFHLRYMPNINNRCRIVQNGTVFNIIDVINVQEKNRALILEGIEVGRQQLSGL